MKFEQLLKIYWSRNFLYGGSTQPFRITFFDFFSHKKGLKTLSRLLFFKRFELKYFFFKKNYSKILNTFPNFYKKNFNIFVSRFISINNSIFELHRYNLIRLFLIRTYRGRCHAIGKPSRGQRTWSNSKNSFLTNKTIRSFIQEVKKLNVSSLLLIKKKESLNKKFTQKKAKKKTPKIKMVVVKKKKKLWF